MPMKLFKNHRLIGNIVKMRHILYSPLIRQYGVVVIVNLSVLTTGMSLAWPSPILVKLSNINQSPIKRPVTDEEASWIVSIGFLCAVFSNTTFAILLDTLGRKYCIILSYLPKLSIGLLFIFATEVWMLIFGRAVIITVDCFVLVVTSVYASEIASKEYRGALGTLLQLSSALGKMVTLSVGPFTSYRSFNIVFTSVIGIAMIPAFFLPESPSFLYSKGRKDEALETLKYLRMSDVLVQEEIEEYQINESRNKTVNKFSFFKNRVFRKALALGIIFCIGTQFSGYSAVTFYLQTILISTDMNVKSEIASVIIGIIQVFISLVAHLLLSSRFGRKTILIWSLSGFFLGMIGLGTFFKITEPDDYKIIGFMNYLPLISIILVICCYIAGMGSLMWVVVGEIFDDSSRALGASISLTAASLMIFISIKTFSHMTVALGRANTYWFFSGISILFLSFIAIFIPETKGKTFNEIQMRLSGKIDNQDISI